MGQLLFWLETAIALVLFVALGTALVSRVQDRARRLLLRIAWSSVALFPWGFAIATFAWVHRRVGGALVPLVSSSVAAGLFIVAAVVVVIRGRRPSAQATGSTAAGWRLNRVALACGAAVVLACMTFWNLDLAVRQAMATTRVEAGAIALSVSPPRVPDSQNAALLYRRALEALDAQGAVTLSVRHPRPEHEFDVGMIPATSAAPNAPTTREVDWREAVDGWLHSQEGEFIPNDEHMLAFLRTRAPVIDLLRQAGDLPGCDFGVAYNRPSIDLLLPHLSKVRSLSQLLGLATRVAADQGRMDEALADLGAAFALAAHMKLEPPLIALLVSASMEWGAFDAFQYVLDQGPLTADSLGALRLDEWENSNVALHRSMRMETAFGMSVFAMPDSLDVLYSRFSPLSDLMAFYRVFLWETDKEAYLQRMRQFEELSARPYHQGAQQWLTPESLPKGGPLTWTMVPSLGRSGQFTVIGDARHRLVVLAVAMWRYRLAHGTFPDELDQLVPEYFLAVPVDPCTGRAMRVVRSDGQVMIYSLGPDGEDDDGAPLDISSMQGDIPLILSR